MKKSTNQNPQPNGAKQHKKPNIQTMINRLRAQYIDTGVTEQELGVIQRAAGNPAQAALAIALVMARLEEEGGRNPAAPEHH